jgi:hypothetical protein
MSIIHILKLTQTLRIYYSSQCSFGQTSLSSLKADRDPLLPAELVQKEVQPGGQEPSESGKDNRYAYVYK